MDGALLLIGQLIIILLATGVMSSLYYGLDHGFRRLHLPARQRKKLLQFILTALAFWLAILAQLGLMGYFYQEGATRQRLMFAFWLPMALIILLLFSRFFSLLLSALPPSWLVNFQACRLVTELFFWMGLKGGFVPVQMTFEWLNYDVVVGITALMAGYVFFGRGRYRRLEAILWNTFGIASLCNVLLLGLVSLPGSYRPFATSPDSSFLTLTPFIWLPGFIFPLALGAHLFALKKLIHQRQPLLYRFLKQHGQKE